MSIKTIIQLKYFFILLSSIILFIGSQIVINEEGNTSSFLEAVASALLIFFLQYAMFSQKLYDALVEEGAILNYKVYQFIGLIVSIVFFIVITLAIKGSYVKMA